MAKLSFLRVLGDTIVDGVAKIKSSLTVGGDVDVEGQINEQNDRVATRNWTNNNADVPNADFADTADQLQGGWDTNDGPDFRYSGRRALVSNSGELMLDYASDHGSVDARSALYETGNRVATRNWINGSVSRIGGSGLYFDFDNDADWIELVNGSGTRKELVTEDVFVNEDGTWLGDHISNSSAHHSRYSDSEAISAVEGARFTELAFDNIENPGSTRSIGIDDSEGPLFKDVNGNTYPIWTSEQVNGGTDINISGGSGAGSTPITLNHADTSSQGNVATGGATVIDDIDLDGRGHVTNLNTENRSLDDWNSANSNISIGGNKITGVTQIDGNAGNHRIRFDSNNSWLEITDQANNRQDLVTQDVYINDKGMWLGDDTIVTVSGGTDINGGSAGLGGTIAVDHADTSSQGNVSTNGATVIDDIDLDGRGHVTNLNTQNRSLDDWLSSRDDSNVSFGSNSDFSISYESSADELVIRDETNGVDLIRQPKQGSTQFIQGADIGSIEAPEDSLTQLANASATSESASGDTIGYTFAVNNQFVAKVQADSDGSGGTNNQRLEVDGNISTSGELTENASL